jgi:hypothetical protein
LFGYLLYLVPLREAIELLSEPEPIYDILIAFGGLCCALLLGLKRNVNSRHRYCYGFDATVHRWIRTSNWEYEILFGAIYLYSINCVLYVFLHFIVTFF